jgi:DNA-binding transcriptional ArsR family regulator
MNEQDDHDLDLILSVLENPIRRRILRNLARENNYPLQLSKELNVSQQAIMKHLKVLEESDFVVSYDEPSNKGGPPRRVFTPRKRYCIRIDIGPNTYNETINTYREYGVRSEDIGTSSTGDRSKLEISGKVTGEIKSEIAGNLPAFVDSKLENIRLWLERTILEKDPSKKALDLTELISVLDLEIVQIESKRRMFVAFRERANEEANNLFDILSKEPRGKEMIRRLTIRERKSISDDDEGVEMNLQAFDILNRNKRKRAFQ